MARGKRSSPQAIPLTLSPRSRKRLPATMRGPSGEDLSAAPLLLVSSVVGLYPSKGWLEVKEAAALRSLQVVEAELRREPDNEHDPQAVAVLLDGKKIGYVAAEDAAEVSDALERGRQLLAAIDASGGLPRRDKGGSFPLTIFDRCMKPT
jgi:hypothetical protein